MPSKVRASGHSPGGEMAHGALRGSGQGLSASQERAMSLRHFPSEEWLKAPQRGGLLDLLEGWSSPSLKNTQVG